MEKLVTVYCGTAMYKDGPQTKTKLTLDYRNLTDDEIRYYADDTCIIKVQNSWRRKKDSTIPEEFTYIVPKPGTRASVDTAAIAHKARVDALKAMMPHLSDEEIEKYAGLLGTAEGAAAFQAAVKADGNN
jgi:predicted house-cleaning NTP pyrophosphatase (Maf/HAM1 superfamily)